MSFDFNERTSRVAFQLIDQLIDVAPGRALSGKMTDTDERRDSVPVPRVAIVDPLSRNFRLIFSLAGTVFTLASASRSISGRLRTQLIVEVLFSERAHASVRPPPSV